MSETIHFYQDTVHFWKHHSLRLESSVSAPGLTSSSKTCRLSFTMCPLGSIIRSMQANVVLEDKENGPKMFSKREGCACQGDSIRSVKWNVLIKSMCYGSAICSAVSTILNCKYVTLWDYQQLCLLIHIFGFSTLCWKVEQNKKYTSVPTEYLSYRGLFKYICTVANSLKWTTLLKPFLHPGLTWWWSCSFIPNND